MSSLKASFELRMELLEHQRSFYQESYSLYANSQEKAYVFGENSDPATRTQLLDVLLKHQIEVYQLLFKKNEYKVSDTGYFVYCNGDTSKKAFDKKIEFDIKVIPYKGDDSWIEQTLLDIHKCLSADKAPEMNDDCDYCRYRKQAAIKSAQEMQRK